MSPSHYGPTLPTGKGSWSVWGISAALSLRLTPTGFISATLAICLLLQRFGLPFGDLRISIAAPLVFSLICWGLVIGILAVDRRRAGLFLALCCVSLIATAIRINAPLAMAPRTSLVSLIYWLSITSVAVLRFRKPLDEADYVRIIDLWLSIVAIAGLVEFAGQFVGLTLFSFEGIIPDTYLVEQQFAVTIPLEQVGVLRSNGFFLVEPSVFSQFMSIGIIVQWVYRTSLRRTTLYFAALLASISGTGWMILGIFVLQIALTTKGQGLRAMILAGLCLAVFGVVSLTFPEVAQTMVERLGEFTLPGTSGYERFVTPFLAMSDVLHVAPWSIVTGIGPGAAEELTLPYVYGLNSPIKIILEYGTPGFLLYLSLLATANRTRRQRAIFLPLLVLLLFAGGYQEFPPILFWVILVGTIANLSGEITLACPATRGKDYVAPSLVPTIAGRQVVIQAVDANHPLRDGDRSDCRGTDGA